MGYETAEFQWQEGQRRMAGAPAEQQPVLDRVVGALSQELRRRLGGAFTIDELVQHYEQGTGWCTDLAVAVAPGSPFAWDGQVVADAAFARYAREATDFAGGRRVIRQ